MILEIKKRIFSKKKTCNIKTNVIQCYCKLIGGERMLDGFKVVNLVSGVPTVTITKNGIAFNKNSVYKMERCERVLLMIDEEGKRLAIQKCDDSNVNATPFFTGQKNNNVRWNNVDLLKKLEQMMNWDLSTDGFKSIGEYFEQDSALIFSLSDSEKIDN